MVMTSLAKALTAPKAGSMRRSENRPFAIQVLLRTDKMFWITKSVILRNVPVTAIRPTKRLAEWRYLFATEGAPKWRGSTGVDTLKFDSRSRKHKAGDQVLAVQAKAQEVLKELAKELKNDRAATYKDGKYRSYEAYRANTIEDLKKLAGRA
jgi:hypothetical protein